MNPRRILLRGKKQRQYFGKRHPRIANTNENLAGGPAGTRNQNSSRAALIGGDKMSGRFGKRQVALARRLGRGQPGQKCRSIAIDLTLESLGNFRGGVGNGNKDVGWRNLEMLVRFKLRRIRSNDWRRLAHGVVEADHALQFNIPHFEP